MSIVLFLFLILFCFFRSYLILQLWKCFLVPVVKKQIAAEFFRRETFKYQLTAVFFSKPMSIPPFSA